jgi:hypothetical protein
MVKPRQSRHAATAARSRIGLYGSRSSETAWVSILKLASGGAGILQPKLVAMQAEGHPALAAGSCQRFSRLKQTEVR